MQGHIQNLPSLDLLEAYWQHVNSVLPHEKRESDKLMAGLRVLHKVHFAAGAQAAVSETSPVETARAVAKGVLAQVGPCLLA